MNYVRNLLDINNTITNAIKNNMDTNEVTDQFGSERQELDRVEGENALRDLDFIAEEAGRTSDELPSDPDPGL